MQCSLSESQNKLQESTECTAGPRATRSLQWWTKAKKISNISSPKTPIPDLEEGSTLVTTDDDKAEILVNFFSAQCFAQTSSSEQCPGAPYPLPENHPEFAFPLICEQEVLRHLQHLPKFKSSKDTCISNRVLRETAHLITLSLTYVPVQSFPEDVHFSGRMEIGCGLPNLRKSCIPEQP